MKDQQVNINISGGAIEKWRGSTLAIAVNNDGKAQKSLSLCGEPVKNEVQRLLKDRWISGKAGETLLVPVPADSVVLAQRVLLVGVGETKKITPEGLRALGAQLYLACKKHNISSINALFALDKHNGIKGVNVIELMAEGALLSSYKFEAFQSKKDDDKKKPTSIKITFASKKEDTSSAKKLLSKVEKICRGVALARDLGNQPGNVLNPETLVEQASKALEDLPVKISVLNEKALTKKGMNGILAVGQGSATPPRMITMEYRKGGDRPLLAVVGKAITFDSGGISIKPSNKMEEMKFDMCGGAAVFGFMQAIAEMKLPINVVGIVPAAENLPSSSAQRPGDIIKTGKGVFVEVINTDAEGRLILADALHHAESFNPAAIIDFATLTGACVVALGKHCSGMMGNDDKLLEALKQVGEDCGDRVWPLPMFDDYQEQIKSTVADIKNVGGPGGGTITAGCFLSRFVEDSRPWAHIDIAGTAWDMGSSKPHFPKGATGVGVRLLCSYVEKNFV
ncbi:MAG: leucyl aminopeptidase [Magnetococcales bacterium]|nr:leucyl aminopeptidase [Magnetococcales bacterium]